MTSATSSIPGRTGLRRPRAIGILVAAALIVGMTYVSSVVPAPAPRRRPPAAPAAALGVPGAADPAAVPGSVAQLDRGIKVWAANLAAEPRDFMSATTLAGLYHERGRLTGDLADHQRALEAAQTAARVAPTEPAGDTSRRPSATRSTTSAARSRTRTRSIAATRPSSAHSPRGQTPSSSSDASATRGRTSRAGVPCRRSGRRHPARPPGVRHRPAGRGAPPRTLRPRWGLAQAAAGETADVGFYQFAAGEYPGWPEMPRRRGRAMPRLLPCATRPRRARRPRADRRLRRAESDAIAGLEERPRSRHSPRRCALLGDLQAADRRRRRGLAPVRDRSLHRAAGRDPEHGLRSSAHPLRARPGGASRPCWPRRVHPSPVAPTLRSRPVAWALASVDSTRRATEIAAASRGRRCPAGVPSRRDRAGSGDAAAVVPRFGGRLRSDRRSTRSSAPRLSVCLGRSSATGPAYRRPGR